jgi:hypothetical protein
MSDASQDFGMVLLDLHPTTTPVAKLPTTQLAINHLLLDRQTRRQSLEDRY